MIFLEKSVIMSHMRNWSTDENQLKKSPEAYAIWRLEQLINFGLGDEKLSIEQLRKYWSQLSLDPARRVFLSFLLHER